MRTLHQRLMASEFSERYLALKQRLPRIKHLIHGGVEHYYAGHEPEHLLSSGVEDRLCDENIERTLTNIEIGICEVMGLGMFKGNMHTYCHIKPPNDPKSREAVWQYRVFIEEMFVAGIGMNFHYEDDNIVATISNIQGRNTDGVAELRRVCGSTPWPVKALYTILGYMSEEIIVRGPTCTQHPCISQDRNLKHRASNLYDRTFRRLGFEGVRDTIGKVKYYQLERKLKI